ncbi:MAG: HIT domain-containing protein [Candidatus Saccharimonadaceae bacterium]|nr:HIT domain-containing protein [Candidatus Saccharimonadaceae bacterium]
MQEPTIFTRIIQGEIPAHIIYEDDRVIAFLDLFPISEGHTLVIPKVQIDHIWDMDDEYYEYLWQTAKKIGKHIHGIIESPRVGVVVEGFGVPHAHIHLVPLYRGDDLKKPTMTPTDSELAAIAERLRM